MTSLKWLLKHPRSKSGTAHEKKIDIPFYRRDDVWLNGAELAKGYTSNSPDIKIPALSMSGQGDLVEPDDRRCRYIRLRTEHREKELIIALRRYPAAVSISAKKCWKEMTHASEKKESAMNLGRPAIEIIRLIEKESKQADRRTIIPQRTKLLETHRKNISRKTNTASVIGCQVCLWLHK